MFLNMKCVCVYESAIHCNNELLSALDTRLVNVLSQNEKVSASTKTPFIQLSDLIDMSKVCEHQRRIRS